ncbi:MAG: superoxide dismutase family protein [Labilithrix sp.]|nr:superoxide dismutase family protein [Labilithrix sp.]
MNRLLAWPVAVAVVMLPGCHTKDQPSRGSSVTHEQEMTAEPSGATVVEVPLAARSGSALTGRAVLTEQRDGVHVVVEVAGISPGKHGTHIHEDPDCSAPDAKSAGAHYNPEGHPHGLPSSDARHIGDLGNLVVGEDGEGRLDVVAPRASLRVGDPRSFVDRSLVVHAEPDDGSQPDGAAGARIGCGEIRRDGRAVDLSR